MNNCTFTSYHSSFNMALKLAVVRGDPRSPKARAYLKFIRGNVALLSLTPMSPAALADLTSPGVLARANAQIGKDRGTVQNNVLKEFAHGAGAGAQFLRDHAAAVARIGAFDFKAFFNYNGGRNPLEVLTDLDSDAFLEYWMTVDKLKCLKKKKVGASNAENGDFHCDHFSAGGTTNARIISYYMQAGELGSIEMRRDGVVVKMEVPPGTSVYMTKPLLEEEHRHAANGRNISFVTEVYMPAFPTSATSAEITAAGAAQPSLTRGLLAAFGKWQPWLFFNSKSGVGFTPASAFKCAVSEIWGAKFGRFMSRRQALEILANKSDEEIMALAARNFDRKRAFVCSSLAHSQISCALFL